MNSSVSPRSYAARTASAPDSAVCSAVAVDEQVVGELDPVPAPVAVHPVVAADDRADPAAAGLCHPGLDLLEVARARRRRGIAAVGEGVEHEVLDPLGRRELDQRVEMLDARVHSTVGDEPDDVDPPAAGEDLPQDLVLGQGTVLDRLVDPGEVLHHDGPGTEVEMPDLRIAHLPLGEPDGTAAGGELGVRVARPTARRTPGSRPARSHCRGRRGRDPSRRARSARRSRPGGRRARPRGSSRRGLDDRRERGRVEARAADERAIDIGQREQLARRSPA